MDARTPADPYDTMPPHVSGQSREDAVTAAIAWEYRKRLACGPNAPYTTHARAFARAALRVLDRDREAHIADHDAVYQSLTCEVCGQTVDKNYDGKWVHT